jgi:hypothetical protein
MAQEKTLMLEREKKRKKKKKKESREAVSSAFLQRKIEYLLCSQMHNRQKAAMQKLHKVRHDAKRNGNAK